MSDGEQPPPRPAGTLPSPPMSEADRQRVQAYFKKRKARRPAPQVKLKQRPGRAADVESDHPVKGVGAIQLLDACGTTEVAFSQMLLRQILNATHFGGKDTPISEAMLNGALAAINGVDARDEVEAMLVAQMTATHAVAMDLLWRMNIATLRPHLESTGNLAVKLLRTCTAQLDALVRYRRRGEQTVRVEHVHVHSGGQAVVGAVTTTGGTGKDRKTEDQAHAKLAHAPVAPMRGSNPEGDAVPVASSAGAQPLPHARRR
jgi:hypothetical protein